MARAYCLQFDQFMEYNEDGFLILSEPKIDRKYLENYDVTLVYDYIVRKLENIFIVKKCILHHKPFIDCETCRNNFTCKHEEYLKDCFHCRIKLRYGVTLTLKRHECHKCCRVTICPHRLMRKKCYICKHNNCFSITQLWKCRKEGTESPFDKSKFIVRKYCHGCLRRIFCKHGDKGKHCHKCFESLFSNL